MAKISISDPEWYNVREKLPQKYKKVILRCGEFELSARRIGLISEKWRFESGFVEPICQYDLWRP